MRADYSGTRSAPSRSRCRRSDAHNGAMDPAAAREQMVVQQIAARGMSDRAFWLRCARCRATCSCPQSSSRRPTPIARCRSAKGRRSPSRTSLRAMTAALEIRGTDRVLEIGTGSGYQTAVLAHLAAEVVSIERHAALAAGAASRLRELGMAHVTVVVGDGSEGWPAAAPYDRILVTAGAPAIPDTLGRPARRRRPAGDSGRARGPPAPDDRRPRGRPHVSVREGEACVFVPLIGRHGWAGSLSDGRVCDYIPDSSSSICTRTAVIRCM